MGTMGELIDHEATASIRSAMPLCATLGITASRLDAHRVVLRLPYDADRCTVGGVLHGGALVTLADSAGAALAHANLPDDASGTATVATSTSFVSAADEDVTASAEPLHVGGRTSTIRIEVRTDDGRLVSHTTQTQVVLRGSGSGQVPPV